MLVATYKCLALVVEDILTVSIYVNSFIFATGILFALYYLILRNKKINVSGKAVVITGNTLVIL